MSTLAPHRRTEARIRRIASLVLSVVAGVVAVANIVILVVRPSTFISDGAFGLDALSAVCSNALPYMPLPVLAAILIVGTLPPLPPGAPSVDALPNRLPMILAIIACVLVVVAIGIPVLMMLMYLGSFFLAIV